ncbi:hypothetical protein EVAR_70167_1 [Eumeta japonica]|uniref:Uncharacterized protein n=1 Tax=Eumeta variegata TaxID=151549 RepID=A0A4C2AGQ3_EUMVA|nr:hypothetical protein EVAR_70167_1 [Eumeta japonica]
MMVFKVIGRPKPRELSVAGWLCRGHAIARCTRPARRGVVRNRKRIYSLMGATLFKKLLMTRTNSVLVVRANTRSRTTGDSNWRFRSCTLECTKFCRSELPANDVMRRFDTPRPFLCLRCVTILRHWNAFMTNFTASEFSSYAPDMFKPFEEREEFWADIRDVPAKYDRNERIVRLGDLYG